MTSFRTGNMFGPAPKVDLSQIFDDRPIEANLRSHLVNVYSSLCMMLFAAAAGSAAHLYFNIGGFLTTMAAMGLVMLLVMDEDKGNVPKRLAIMSAFGFFKGASIGPLIAYAAHVDPSLILTAFLGTATIFMCFTLSAFYAHRQQYIALGGLLSSGLSLLFWVSIINMFFRSEFAFNVSLYLGLFIFCGYVLYDTQIIMAKFRNGDRDFAMHAVELFIDFVAIFVRILIILVQNQEKKNEKRRR